MDGVDRDREALRSAQTKLQASKNTKEWGAASREVDNKRKLDQRPRGRAKKVGRGENTSGNAALEGREKDVNAIRTQLSGRTARPRWPIRRSTSRPASPRRGPRATPHCSQVEKQYVKQYDTLIGKRGYAVAPVVKGVCQGCHMALPPQLNNILARMQAIETSIRAAAA